MGSAGSGVRNRGDVVVLAVEVMLDGNHWWLVVDSDAMRNGRR